MQKTVIIVPVSSYIEPKTDQSLRILEFRGFDVWREYGWSAIDQGRCALAQKALDLGFESIFWIDSDMDFNPDDVQKLINHNLPIVSAPYSVKGHPSLTTEFYQQNVNLGQNGGLHLVKYAATGFLFTHKSVYLRIAEFFKMDRIKIWGGVYSAFPYFFPIIHEQEYVGEDFAFCLRARMAGLEIFSDTSIKLGHIGRYSYGFDFLNRGYTVDPLSVSYTQSDKYQYA